VLGWRTAAVAGAVQTVTLIVAAELTGAAWHANELLVAIAAFGLTAVAARIRTGAGLPPQRPISSG
jgi:glucose-6-phosphate-specific signal transduction histidine kinase